MANHYPSAIIRLSLLLLGFAALLPCSSAETPPRPNIVIFYVDDMGWGAIGPNGQEARRANGLPSVKTPHIDSLAQEGINFQRGYGCTVCSPARSTMLTGFHQGHTWADRNDPDNAKKAMRAEDFTFGDVLKAAGYNTGYWGKWGYGGSQNAQNPQLVNRQTLPHEHGFDHVLAELHHLRAHSFFQRTLWSYQPGDPDLHLIPNNLAAYQSNPSYPEYPALQNHPNYPATAYCDDYYAFAALDFVREKAVEYQETGKPFLAVLAPQIPHSPFDDIEVMPEVYSAYQDEDFFDSLSTEAKNWAAMVTRIDAHFGNILAALEDPNHDGDTSDSVAGNTLVIFMSDNGGPNNRAHIEFGSNGDLRGQKGSIYEAGIRVPLVMRWPAKISPDSPIPAGSNSQVIFDSTDLLPTFCELAGAPIPLGVDGVSKAGLLTGESNDRPRDFIIHEAHPDQSIIRGNMKLVNDGGSLRLYDLDVSESADIAVDHPDLVTELATLLQEEQVYLPAWHAVTYHHWAGADGDVTSDADHWSDYSYTNAVNGTTYDEESGSPSIMWIARMENDGPTPSTAEVDGDLQFLALQIGGGSHAQILDLNGHRVSGRNEIRIGSNGMVALGGGTLHSLRWIELVSGGVLSGQGEIDGTLYHSGLLSTEGNLRIHGDYHAEPEATSALPLDGNPALQIDGVADLHGQLMVEVPPEITPALGMTYELVKAASIEGRYTNPENLVTGSDGSLFVIRYEPDCVLLEVTGRTSAGTPFSWLDEYGLAVGGAYEAADVADDDADGWLAREEYRWGTNPLEADSKMWQAVGMNATTLQLEWLATEGRLYHVEYSSDLIVPFQVKAGPLVATPPRNQWSTPLEGERGFYRVTVQSP